MSSCRNGECVCVHGVAVGRVSVCVHGVAVGMVSVCVCME